MMIPDAASVAPIDWPLWVAAAAVVFSVLTGLLVTVFGLLLTMLGVCGMIVAWIFRKSLLDQQRETAAAVALCDRNYAKHERDLQNLGDQQRRTAERLAQFADLNRSDIMPARDIQRMVDNFTGAVRELGKQISNEIAAIEAKFSTVMNREEFEKRHTEMGRRIAAAEEAAAVLRNKSTVPAMGG